MKEKWLLFLFLPLTTSPLLANDGWWLPLLFAQIEEIERQELGINLSAEEIYSPDQGSLTDAVVQINGQCSGTVISEKGLVLTHSDCVPAMLAQPSGSQPFQALGPSEEVPIPGMTVTFTIRMEEVTEAVLESISDGLPDKLRRAAIARNIRNIEQAAPRASHQNARVHTFYGGNRYYLFITETYRDIRLAGRVTATAGEDRKGAPLLPGFSLLRIYADANRHPADFSEDNVPYRPRQPVTISPAGPEAGAATLTMGFPLHSKLHLPSAGLALQTEALMPAEIEVLQRKLIALQAAADEAGPVLRYQAVRKSVIQELEKSSGALEGLLASSAVRKKQAGEARLLVKIDSSNMLKTRYGRLLPQLETQYAALRPYALARTYTEAIAFRQVELFRLFNTLRQFIRLYERAGATVLERQKAKLLQFTDDFFDDYHPATDQAVLAEMLKLYYQKLRVDLLSPQVAEQVHLAEKDFDRLASFIFMKTSLTQPRLLRNLLAEDPVMALKYVQRDAAYQLFQQMVEMHEEKVLPAYEAVSKEIEQLQRQYLEAQLKLFPEQALTPNANGTLRISPGRLQAAPVFLQDLRSDNASFLEIKKLLQSKRSSRYAEEDRLSVFFTSNAHTIPGYEGGPVLDVDGRLLGIHWERPPESTMSSWHYNPDLCRSTVLDIRYVLLIVEQYAPELMKEMRIEYSDR